jgi:hypothetical protein
MVSVQAEHCAPIVKAFEAGAERSEMWQNARTVADGLRVPKGSAPQQRCLPSKEVKGQMKQTSRTLLTLL